MCKHKWSQWKRRWQVYRCQRQLKRLYAHVNPTAICISERQRLNLTDPAFVYGEVKPNTLAEMLSLVAPQPHEIFYDLGSGSGIAVFCTALLYPLQKACGVELLPKLHELSLELKESLPPTLTPIEFIQANMLDYNFCDADIVYINATGLFADSWEKVVQKLAALKPGSRILLTSKTLPEHRFEPINCQYRLMSWGYSRVNLYRVRAPNTQ